MATDLQCPPGIQRAAHAARKSQILLVEDSQTQAINVCHVLQKEGWDVVWAATAERAMDEISRNPPDLIVVDFYLPGIRGDELCRRIRMNIDTRRIPIIMLTVDEAGDAELRGLESGADDFVQKSADTDILVLRVRAMLSKSKAMSSILGPADAAFRRARLLTIDDSPTYLEHLAGRLGRDGYQVERASSGAEGLRKLASQTFDCALVDLVMPEMNGIDVCRQINELRSGMAAPITVLMLTAHENKEDLTRALEAGADDFVGKSSDMAVLKGRIRALLRRKFYQEENQRIIEELKSKELEAVRARAQAEVVEARAALYDELQVVAADLTRSRQELQALNQSLEQRVAERTRELDQRNIELEQKNAELDQYVYIASHDLQEPLRKVVSFSQLLEQDVGANLNEAARKDMYYIVEAAQRMQKLVQDLLAYSRAGRSAMRWETVSLDDCVDRALDALAIRLQETGGELTRDPLPELRGDRTLLTQLYQNLICNALKFVRGRRPQIRLTAELNDGCWTLGVRDNGIGIAPEYRRQIFGPFQRLHGRGEFDGAGVGLAICQTAVERHGGAIWVESQPGIGSHFKFTLSGGRGPADSPPPPLDINKQ